MYGIKKRLRDLPEEVAQLKNQLSEKRNTLEKMEEIFAAIEPLAKDLRKIKNAILQKIA